MEGTAAEEITRRVGHRGGGEARWWKAGSKGGEVVDAGRGGASSRLAAGWQLYGWRYYEEGATPAHIYNIVSVASVCVAVEV